MNETKLPKSIKRITILKSASGRTPAGGVEPVVVTGKRRARKSKGLMRIAERMVKTAAKAQLTSIEDYLDRHDRSSSKKRDGWMRDYMTNMARANGKGMRKLRVTKLLFR